MKREDRNQIKKSVEAMKCGQDKTRKIVETNMIPIRTFTQGQREELRMYVADYFNILHFFQ